MAFADTSLALASSLNMDEGGKESTYVVKYVDTLFLLLAQTQCLSKPDVFHC